MADFIARGQYTVVKLYNGKNMQLNLRCNLPAIQFFSHTTKQFNPNYSATPIVITPELIFSGSTDNQMAHATNVEWTINGKKPIEFGGVTAAKLPYTLTINRNMVSTPQMLVRLRCTIKDPDTKLPVSIAQDTCFTKRDTDNFTPSLMVETVDGTVFNDEVQDELTATCGVYKGATHITDDITYKWFENDGKDVYLEITDSPNISGQGTDTLTVKRTAVRVPKLFKCEVVYGKATYLAFVQFSHKTVPYTIKIESSSDKIKNGVGMVHCEAHVYRGKKLIPDDVAERNFQFHWKKYNKNTGQQDTAWRNPIARCIQLTKHDITRLSTFMCELTSNNGAFPYDLPFELQ